MFQTNTRVCSVCNEILNYSDNGVTCICGMTHVELSNKLLLLCCFIINM